MAWVADFFVVLRHELDTETILFVVPNGHQ